MGALAIAGIVAATLVVAVLFVFLPVIAWRRSRDARHQMTKPPPPSPPHGSRSGYVYPYRAYRHPPRSAGVRSDPQDTE